MLRPTRGHGLAGPRISATGLSPCIAGLSRPFPCRAPVPRRGPATPGGKPPGLGYCAFARRYLRNHCLFSSPAGTEMFHFPAFPPTALYIQAAATCHHARQVPPFGHPRINARLAAPRGLSRPPTSFIGAWCQGIHRVPHSLGHHRNKTLAHTIHKSKPTPHTQPTHTTRHAPARMARTTPTHPHPQRRPTAASHRPAPQPTSPRAPQPANRSTTGQPATKPPSHLRPQH